MTARITDWLMTDHGYTHADAATLVADCEDWHAKERALPQAERRTARQLAEMFHQRFQPTRMAEDFA